MTLVVDASVAGAWLLPDETSGQAESILERVASGDVDLAVPELWLYELTNLLVSARRRGRISGEHVDAAQRLIDAVPYETFGLDSALVRQRAGAARRALWARGVPRVLPRAGRQAAMPLGDV